MSPIVAVSAARHQVAVNPVIKSGACPPPLPHASLLRSPYGCRSVTAPRETNHELRTWVDSIADLLADSGYHPVVERRSADEMAVPACRC